MLKVLSPDVSHKSDVGGVELNLDDEGAVRDAFERIRRNLAAKARDARFEGVAVQPMARQGVELIAGTFRDERFGPMVMVGIGGVFVEVMNDTALALAPIGGREASAMLAQLRGAQILRGVRGQPGVDIDAIASLLETVSGIAWTHPEIAEMDLNPVVAYEDGLAILDARIVLADAKAATPQPDGNRAARLKNLERAFNPRTVAVIGDKRMGGYMWLRAMAHLKGKLYSIQIDANEIPGIEAMGVENRKSLAEIAEPIDYAVSAVPRQIAPRILKDCVANHVGSIGFFTSGFSETSEELGIRLESELRDIAINSEIALVGPNCMGLYSPGGGPPQFSRGKSRRGGRRLLHLPERDAHDQLLPAGSDSRNQGEQGGVDRQRAGSRGRRLYRPDGGRPGHARNWDVYRGCARRPALFRQRPARGRAASGRHLEGRGDRGGRARDVLAHRIARDCPQRPGEQ